MRSKDSVLFVSPGPDLLNPASGEGVRLANFSRELADRGWRVFTLVPTSTSGNVPDWITRQYSYDQWSVPHLMDLNPSFVLALRRVLKTKPIDVCHLSRGVCVASLLASGTETSVVYAAQNVEADHARDFVDPELPAYKRVLGPRIIPSIEQAAVHCADGITTVSGADRERMIKRYSLNESTVKAVPTGTRTVDKSSLEDPAVFRERFGLDDVPLAVFHGSYDHAPNREAAELIDTRIAPSIRGKGSDLEFVLLGKEAPETSSENVHALGFVEHLDSVLNIADLAVVPILHGAGTKTKLYDYISLGLPMVATERAVKGINLERNVHARILDSVDEEFSASIVELVERPELRREMSTRLDDLSSTWKWSISASRLQDAYRAWQE